MRVTVCELRSASEHVEDDWTGLVDHVRERQSELVVLPEMGFSPWFARDRDFDAATWEAAVASHARWLERLSELDGATVLGTRPAGGDGPRRNEAYVFDLARGVEPAHTKAYLPEEDGFWEASWYERGDGRFALADAGRARTGFLVCTEMWFLQHARDYGRAGAHVIATPRCTPRETLDKWLAGGRTCAVVAGAYSLSSNHGDDAFGGLGWIVDPDGEVLATTSRREPWVTVEIDLEAAEAAKRTYPRYVTDIERRAAEAH